MFKKWFQKILAFIRDRRERIKNEELTRIRSRYHVFRALLNDNHQAIELLTKLGSSLRSQISWKNNLIRETNKLINATAEMVEKLEYLSFGKTSALIARQQWLSTKIKQTLNSLPDYENIPMCISLDEISPAIIKIVGGKTANLALLRKTEGFSVPSGFVASVSSCRFFLETEDLYLRILGKFSQNENPKTGLPDKKIVDQVNQMILETDLPQKLSDALLKASEPFFKRGKALAVRSSAVSEDKLEHSFAGQYVSVINVINFNQLLEAFKTVIASAFNIRNLTYRKNAGLSVYDFDLAVLCLQMVDVRSSGILFTIDPNFTNNGKMLITAVNGLGELAVSGSDLADIYRPARDGSDQKDCQIAVKSKRLVSSQDGGVKEEQLDPALSSKAVLSESEIKTLVKLGVSTEKLFGRPQDIEWAVNREGEIILLQTRALRTTSYQSSGQNRDSHRKPLLSGGLVASPGLGAGKIRIIGTQQDLKNLREPPYILVMHQSMVEAVSVLSEVSALLIEIGNPTDHLSCIAREYQIPMLTGISQASKKLSNGDNILIDCDRKAVFTAEEKELKRYHSLYLQRKDKWQDQLLKPDNQLAAALYDMIVPLNLTDAYGPTFSIVECLTLHDITRYAHEKAVLSMFEAGDTIMEKVSSSFYAQLESEVPFHVSIIDLGGGILGNKGGRIKADDILSSPFTALWRGVRTPGLNWKAPTGGVAIGSVMSRFLSDQGSARPIGMPNYALITRDFLNLNARMDFHFTMIDSVCGLDSSLNYVKFRFKGGGTDFKQRCRRVQCLTEIMSFSGFYCDRRDDLLTASIQGGKGEIIEEKLELLGKLLGFTRLLDAAMHNDNLVSKIAQAFLEGDYHLKSLEAELNADQN